MAKKKYENIKLEQKELESVAIGEYGSKKKSSIGTFIIITIFVVAIIFLPEISSYVTGLVSEWLGTGTTSSKPSTPVTPTPEEPNETENYADTFYAFDTSLSIKRDDITVSDFVIDLENNTLTYEITNNSDTYQNIEDLNYYLELYTADKRFMERIKLVHDLYLNSGSFKTFTSNISSNASTSLGQVVLLKKQTSDYPILELTPNENGEEILLCTRVNEEVTYKFENNLLKEMVHEYTYDATSEDYQEVFTNYRSLSNTYNNKTGISSDFFDNTSSFTVATLVNLNEASRTYIFNADTFKLDTESKVVNFEMESQNFTCN